jgi:dipeptidyl aminopeptidase/acylaminoacyl peptidase
MHYLPDMRSKFIKECWYRAQRLEPYSLRHLLHSVLEPANNLIGARPADHGLLAHTVSIPSANGINLFAWFVPSLSRDPCPAIVLLHGWGGNASDLLPAARSLHSAGYAVLLLEARNHGRSDHDDHSSLPRFAEDLDSAIDWLSEQVCVDAQRIVAMGHSVGGAAALLSASRRSDLLALVSVGAFAHPEQLMRRWFATRGVPYWPLGWLLNRYLERVIGARFDDIAPLNTLTKVNCPILLIHGRQDSVVPIEDARLIWQQRSGTDVTLLEYEGTHDKFDNVEEVIHRIIAFLHPRVQTAMLQGR